MLAPGGRRRKAEETQLTVSALGAVHAHAGDLWSFAGKTERGDSEARGTGAPWRRALTSAVEQEVVHVVAEGDVHVAAVELAGQAAAVERGDGVGAAGSGCGERGQRHNQSA